MSKRTIPDEFVPLSVHYRRDRAIRAVGIEGETLFVRSLAFSRANKTVGRIEDFDLDELGGGLSDPGAVAEKLVAVRLWVEDGDGWRIRSWEKWNPTTDSSSAGTLGNHKRWHVERGVIEPTCQHCVGGDDRPNIAPISPPTRPDDRGDVGKESQKEKEREKKKEKEKENSSSELRPDVVEILDHLDQRIEANGARKPNRTKANVDAARLLLDSDHRDPSEIHRLIDWSTSNDFWRAHILNAKKLREKFDTLAMQSQSRGRPDARQDLFDSWDQRIPSVEGAVL